MEKNEWKQRIKINNFMGAQIINSMRAQLINFIRVHINNFIRAQIINVRCLRFAMQIIFFVIVYPSFVQSAHFFHSLSLSLTMGSMALAASPTACTAETTQKHR
jgi:hypothetical protein